MNIIAKSKKTFKLKASINMKNIMMIHQYGMNIKFAKLESKKCFA